MIRPNGELLFSEDRISVWKEESILEMAVVMVSQQCEYVQGHWIVYLQMVKMVNFMLHTFDYSF